MQLTQSIDKLFHYLLPYVKYDMSVVVYQGDEVVYDCEFVSPKSISISPTLYSRIDACHGAGACCRVPFSLIYTSYDRQRILDYNGTEFQESKKDLLSNLQELRCYFTFHNGNGKEVLIESKIYVRENTEINVLSGCKSCPYLLVESDRYLCGIHPFKPMHCWWPHMTVRVMSPRFVEGEKTPSIGSPDRKKPSISIGRAQYGRNYRFGCPVIFGNATKGISVSDGLFVVVDDGVNYFDQQYANDLMKLDWAAKSAKSLGFDSSNSVAIDLGDLFSNKAVTIHRHLSDGIVLPIELWKM